MPGEEKKGALPILLLAELFDKGGVSEKWGQRVPGFYPKRLSLSSKTVSNYTSNIFSKLQVADRAQAMLRAREG